MVIEVCKHRSKIKIINALEKAFIINKQHYSVPC